MRVFRLSGSVWAGRSTTRSHSSSLLSDNATPPVLLNWHIIGWPTILAVLYFEWTIWLIPVVVIGTAMIFGAINFDV